AHYRSEKGGRAGHHAVGSGKADARANARSIRGERDAARERDAVRVAVGERPSRPQRSAVSPDRFEDSPSETLSECGRDARSPHTVTASRTPADSRSAAALSVASHENSGSVRPKCPYAAVFL